MQTDYSQKRITNTAYSRLKDVILNGLPPRLGGKPYDTFYDYFDLNILPWTPELNKVAAKQIMNKSDYQEVVHNIQKKFNFDMDSNLKRALHNQE